MSSSSSSSAGAAPGANQNTSKAMVQANAPTLNPQAYIIDPTNMILSQADQEHIDLIKTWWEQKKTQRRTGSFRLMDLPPEIRVRVYSFVFADNAQGGLNLTKFKVPAIARTSQLVRKEALPLFFSESPFILNVKSNMRDRKMIRDLGTLNHDYRAQGAAGQTRILYDVRSIVRQAGPAALLRNLTIKVHGGAFLIGNRPNDPTVTVYIRFEVVKGTLRVGVTKGRKHPDTWNYAPFEARDVDAAVRQTIEQARAIERSRTEFKGFNLDDVDRIARALKYRGSRFERP